MKNGRLIICQMAIVFALSLQPAANNRIRTGRCALTDCEITIGKTGE